MILAADLDKSALELVKRHFSPLISRNKSVEDLVEYLVDYSGERGSFASQPRILDKELESYRGRISLLAGGPPCQGHSNLNNKTRREDPRNLLYFAMPAIAIGLDIPNIVIENVPTVNNSKVGVVKITADILKRSGYYVDEIVLNSSEFGVAQTRLRHFLVASKEPLLSLRSVSGLLKTEPLTFADLAMDMPALDFDFPLLNTNGSLSIANMERIGFLQSNNVFDLPNAHRPDCHKEFHTYPSVYGRIYPDQPMQTITTGFSSPGRGRYVHPVEPRTITIREAGRIQAFPDWYWREAQSLNFKRADFNKIIGDAVPSVMIEPVVLSLFGSLVGSIQLESLVSAH
jgi:DNA (cytosine-5)-methyltransferase 1